MNPTRRTRFWPLVLALTFASVLLCQPWPLATLLELLSSGVALLATLSSETQIETHLEALLENCQAQMKRVQLAWQRLSFGTRMAAVTALRVFGPFFCLLPLAALELRRSSSQQQEAKVNDRPC